MTEMQDQTSTQAQAEQAVQHKERERYFGAAKTVAGLTLMSRVLGMFRDMTITWLGTTAVNDAFAFAFAMPNLFRRLFGEGAFSAAFVPIFSETVDRENPDKARRLLANAGGLMAVFLLALMLLVQAILLAYYALDPAMEYRRYLLRFSSLMLPFMVTVCLLALGSAVLNVKGRFAYPAAAPIILNVCMIAADGVAWLFWRGSFEAQLTTIAASVSVAGVIQLVGVLWLLRACGFSIRPRLKPVEPGIKQILVLMAPALLGLGFLQLSSLFDYLAMAFFSVTKESSTFTVLGHELMRPLTEGTTVRVTAANRLGQFPMGVLALSLATAVFPLFSLYSSRNDMPSFRQAINRALRLAMMEGLAAGVGLLVLAEPVIRVIFEHGKFSHAATLQTAAILQLYVLGMWAFCCHPILSRAFYSLKDPKTPLRISCLMAAIYMPMIVLLVWMPRVGQNAFGLVPAATFSINVVVLIVILQRRLGSLGLRSIAASFARSAVASAAMAGVILLLRHVLDLSGVLARGLGHVGMNRPTVVLLAEVLICVVVGAATFIGVARLLKAPELGELMGSLRKRQPAPPASTSE